MDILGTKVLRVFLLAIHSHLLTGVTYIVYGNLKSENLCTETSTNLYVHEFGLWKGTEIYEEEGGIAGISSLFYWFSKIPEGDDLFPPFRASTVILPHGHNN